MNVDDSTGMLWTSARPSINHEYASAIPNRDRLYQKRYSTASRTGGVQREQPLRRYSKSSHTHHADTVVESQRISPASDGGDRHSPQETQDDDMEDMVRSSSQHGFYYGAESIGRDTNTAAVLAASTSAGQSMAASPQIRMSGDPQPEWTRNLDQLVAMFQEKCSKRIVLHRESAHYYAKRMRWLSVPSALFGTLASVTNFSTWSQDFNTMDHQFLKYIILAAGVCGLISTVLGGLLADSKYPAKYASSLKSYRNFDSLLKNLTVERSFEPSWRQPVREFVRKMVEDYTRYTDDAELTPHAVEKRVQKAFEDASRNAAEGRASALAAAQRSSNNDQLLQHEQQRQSHSPIRDYYYDEDSSGAGGEYRIPIDPDGYIIDDDDERDGNYAHEDDDREDNGQQDNNQEDDDDDDNTAASSAHHHQRQLQADQQQRQGDSWNRQQAAKSQRRFRDEPPLQQQQVPNKSRRAGIFHLGDWAPRKGVNTERQMEDGLLNTTPSAIAPSTARYCDAMPFSAMIEMQSPTFVETRSASESLNVVVGSSPWPGGQKRGSVSTNNEPATATAAAMVAASNNNNDQQASRKRKKKVRAQQPQPSAANRPIAGLSAGAPSRRLQKIAAPMANPLSQPKELPRAATTTTATTLLQTNPVSTTTSAAKALPGDREQNKSVTAKKAGATAAKQPGFSSSATLPATTAVATTAHTSTTPPLLANNHNSSRRDTTDDDETTTNDPIIVRTTKVFIERTSTPDGPAIVPAAERNSSESPITSTPQSSPIVGLQIDSASGGGGDPPNFVLAASSAALPDAGGSSSVASSTTGSPSKALEVASSRRESRGGSSTETDTSTTVVNDGNNV